MKLNSYPVEFLPLERRLMDRRLINTTPGLFACEKRIDERRRMDEKDGGNAEFDFYQDAKPVLTH